MGHSLHLHVEKQQALPLQLGTAGAQHDGDGGGRAATRPCAIPNRNSIRCKLAKIETLWSTSEVAEKLARHAMESLPPLPPTPTGQPLVFEQTIAFVPYESGWPPIYKYDCFADAPTFKNPFVWNGTSPQVDPPIVPRSAPPPTKAPNHVGCHNDAQPDSMEAETADIKRQFDFWGVRLWNGVK